MYALTIHDTILPSKFLFKQSWASKDIKQKPTFTKETQAKRVVFTSENFLTQRWSAPFSRRFSRECELRERCVVDFQRESLRV